MEQTYSSPVGDAYKYDPDYHRTAEFLGVDRYDRDDFSIANKISIIKDWAGLQGKEDLASALNEINTLKKKVGTNSLGKTLVNELYQHIRLSMESPKSGRKVAKKAEKSMSIGKAIESAIKNSISETVKKAIKEQLK